YGRLENTLEASVPGRCINLARQGFVVFSYDMVGYNDTDQFPHGDHGSHLGGPREDLWSINTMGLQLWNSIRAVDFLSSQPDVDPGRIGATGASGGGTQTFLLMAVDERVKAAAPVNMISSIMQGNGCEEAPNLRVGAFNVMFAAKRSTEELAPRDRATLDKARAAFGERLTFSLLDAKPAAAGVIWQEQESLTNGETLLLARAGEGDRIPTVWLVPPRGNSNAAPTLIVHPNGVAWGLASS